MTRKKVVVIAISALALALNPSGDSRAVSLINGNFESYTPGSNPTYPTGDLQYSPLTGWTSPPLDSSGTTTGNLLFTPGSADTTGVLYVNTPGGGSAVFGLWGPHSGIPNGLPATSPVGGNYVGLDADPLYNGALSQTVTGLTAGQAYQVSFYWAGAQLWTTSGANTERLQVSFGSQTQSTVTLNNVSQGFTGWRPQSFNFTADGPSDLLSFLAIGTPAGLPPFVLLDGVTLSAVPEPSALILVSLGLVGIGVFRRLHGRGKPAAA